MKIRQVVKDKVVYKGQMPDRGTGYNRATALAVGKFYLIQM